MKKSKKKIFAAILFLLIVVSAVVYSLKLSGKSNTYLFKESWVGVSDCEVQSGKRSEDWEYISSASANRKTLDCAPVRVFNPDVVAEQYRYLLEKE